MKNCILDEIITEYEEIKREKQLSELDHTLESIFYTNGKAAMMRAKFYHECQLLKIPCVLDVHTQYGEVDAIIEIENKYLIIEFKSFKSLISSKETKKQLERYSLHHYPVILIYESKMFHSFLRHIKKTKLEDKIYLFDKEEFIIY